MGDCVRAIQADSHERHHDVYVWQQSANIQHNDGFHALQGSYPRPALDQHGLCKVRDRWDPYQVEGRQGCLRFNATVTVRVGRVEGEYDGTVTVRFPFIRSLFFLYFWVDVLLLLGWRFTSLDYVLVTDFDRDTGLQDQTG